MDASNNQLIKLNINNLRELEYLNVSSNQLIKLYLNKLDKLNNLNASYNKLDTINGHFENLRFLKLSNNVIDILYLENLKLLEILDLRDNILTDLKLGSTKDDVYVFLGGNYKLNNFSPRPQYRVIY